MILGSADESSSDDSDAPHDSAHATRAASPPASASAAREMHDSPTKRARLATDRAADSGAALSQEGPFGRDCKTKCADAVDCTFRQGGWEGSPGPFDAAHGTRVTVTLTGAGADDMEVEKVGDTAVQRGNDAEVGARMDCDGDCDEGGVPWVTVHPVTVTFGVDVMMTDLSTDETAEPHVSKKKSPGKKRGKNRRQAAGQWLKHNAVPPPT